VTLLQRREHDSTSASQESVSKSEAITKTAADFVGSYTGKRGIMGAMTDVGLTVNADSTYSTEMAMPFGKMTDTGTFTLVSNESIKLSAGAKMPQFFAEVEVKLDVTAKTASYVEPDDGNQSAYDAANTPVLDHDTNLTGKTIYWLGSSVTVGMEAGNQSMADYIAKRNKAVCVKEAVSGTTLFDSGDAKSNSYVARLKKGAFDASASIDAFVCQISTNDCKAAVLNKWGETTGNDVRDLASFDITTTLGAVEYIIAYVRQTWSCPIFFYSGSSFVGPVFETLGTDYNNLVKKVETLSSKWNNLYFIDLFNDAAFNNITKDQYNYYMGDGIHPKKAGYLKWWTPKFEEIISAKI
jgi:lysophospholipase L1-like esterase